MLYLTGTAEVIWDSDRTRAYPGAERLIRFQITEGHRVEGRLPLRWSEPDYSPLLQHTGPRYKTILSDRARSALDP